MPLSPPPLSPDELARRDAFTGRLFEATLGAWDLLAAALGLQLGYYQALADHGAMTAPQLARATGTDARYAREWLEQQAATGILEVDDVTAAPDARRFTLPAGHAEALLDPDTLATVAPMIHAVAAAGLMLPSIAAAYRTGDGVEWPAYPGLIEAQELANRPVFRHLLTQEWLPSIPDIHARLRDGGRVADVATGTGWSAIAMAAGYPNARVDGLDIDELSIAKARANAAREGADGDRLRFHLVDAGRNDLDGRYDLVTIFEALHDMARPVEVLEAARRLLAPGGAVLVMDENVADSFEAPGNDIDRVMYGYSVFFCLANGLVDKPSAGTGTVIRPATVRRYALDAGFSAVTILPIEHESFRFYRLDP